MSDSAAPPRGQLIHGAVHFPCEVCGTLTPSYVADVRETEPVIRPEDGLPYFCAEPGESHYLCRRHLRDPKVTPYFRSDAHRCAWLARQELYMARIGPEKAEAVRRKAAEHGGDV